MTDVEDFVSLQSAYEDSRAAFHSLIVHRIYHEDNLFAQRTYFLLAIHAFLVGAFSVLLTREWKTLMPFPLMIPALGALLAFFQALYGRQTNRAIAFWREYLKLIEATSHVPFDHLQYQFYKTASVETAFGSITKTKGYQKPRDDVFPKWLRWLLKPFTSVTVAIPTIFSPLLVLFWGVAAWFVLCKSGHPNWAGAAVVSIVLLVSAIVYHAIVIAKPDGTKKASGEASQ